MNNSRRMIIRRRDGMRDQMRQRPDMRRYPMDRERRMEDRDYQYDDYDGYYDGMYDYGMRDYGSGVIKLSPEEMEEWGRKLKNTDGTIGKHYMKNDIIPWAQKMGITFNNYTEDELCMAVNMIYSDYGRRIKQFVSPDKELPFIIGMAQDFLEDMDSSAKGSEKIAKYYYYVADCEEDYDGYYDGRYPEYDGRRRMR